MIVATLASCQSPRSRLRVEEADGVRAQLQEVTGYSAEVDPTTGEPVAVPLPWIKGDQRIALERRYQLLGHEITQMDREAQRRLKDALGRDRAIIRSRREAFQINAEADRRAADAIREQRVAKLAEGKVKRLSSNL